MDLRPLLLGIDTGQTVTKVALFDPDGAELATSSVATRIAAPHPRWQERDMDEIWAQTAGVIRDCLAKVPGAEIAGVGLCGHNDGLHLVDGRLRPVRPAVLATDSRAHEYAVRTAAGDLGARALACTGQVPFAGSPASLLAWLRDHEPDSFARIRWMLCCKDWVRLRLTGEVATDPSEASASFTDVRTQRWSEEALRLYGLEALSGALPPILDSAGRAGEITAEAAGATGLRAGTPVITGAHDVDANAIGLGAIQPGALSVIMGTFSINQVVGTEPRTDARWQARSFVRPGQWLHMSTSPSGASNLEWVVREFGPWDSGARADPAAAISEAFGSASGQRPGPVFLPFLYGSPHGDSVPAALFGLRGWHNRGDVLRAVLHGVVFNHRTHVDALRERFDVDGRAARVSGGGARSPEWTQLLADALGVPVEVTDSDQAGARGAALLAGVGVGRYAGLAGTAALARVVRRHEPDETNAAELAGEYDRYLRLVSALREVPAGPAGSAEEVL